MVSTIFFTSLIGQCCITSLQSNKSPYSVISSKLATISKLVLNLLGRRTYLATSQPLYFLPQRIKCWCCSKSPKPIYTIVSTSGKSTTCCTSKGLNRNLHALEPSPDNININQFQIQQAMNISHKTRVNMFVSMLAFLITAASASQEDVTSLKLWSQLQSSQPGFLVHVHQGHAPVGHLFPLLNHWQRVLVRSDASQVKFDVQNNRQDRVVLVDGKKNKDGYKINFAKLCDQQFTSQPQVVILDSDQSLQILKSNDWSKLECVSTSFVVRHGTTIKELTQFLANYQYDVQQQGQIFSVFSTAKLSAIKSDSSVDECQKNTLTLQQAYKNIKVHRVRQDLTEIESIVVSLPQRQLKKYERQFLLCDFSVEKNALYAEGPVNQTNQFISGKLFKRISYHLGSKDIILFVQIADQTININIFAKDQGEKSCSYKILDEDAKESIEVSIRNFQVKNSILNPQYRDIRVSWLVRRFDKKKELIQTSNLCKQQNNFFSNYNSLVNITLVAIICGLIIVIVSMISKKNHKKTQLSEVPSQDIQIQTEVSKVSSHKMKKETQIKSFQQ